MSDKEKRQEKRNCDYDKIPFSNFTETKTQSSGSSNLQPKRNDVDKLLSPKSKFLGKVDLKRVWT